MGPEGVAFRPHDEILRFEEIERLVRLLVSLGIRRVRLTGGDPLVRRGIVQLVERLAAIDGIEDLSMTTNGVLLGPHAAALRAAGLHRVNVSLDTLDREKFRELTRRDRLADVLAGIEAARQAGLEPVKLNAVAMRGFSEDEIVRLAVFANTHRLPLRFIEFMPLDAGRQWTDRQVLTGAEILRRLARVFGPLQRIDESDKPTPAVRYRFEGLPGEIGLITSCSEPFCRSCPRLRLTADGQLRPCLFSTEAWGLRTLLRVVASDDELVDSVRQAVAGKAEGRGTSNACFARPRLSMYEIGG